MEKRDEFTDQNALAMMMEKSGLPENSCRMALRALNRNGFVVKEVVDEDSPSKILYGTIESLNQKFDRAKELEIERQGLINAIKREWNDIQKKYRPIFNAIASAIGTAQTSSDAFPDLPEEDLTFDEAVEKGYISGDATHLRKEASGSPNALPEFDA